jgi:hypothetical protein
VSLLTQNPHKKSTAEHAENAEVLLDRFSADSAVIVVRRLSSIIVYGAQA